jgi:hypothetical protein
VVLPSDTSFYPTHYHWIPSLSTTRQSPRTRPGKRQTVVLRLVDVAGVVAVEAEEVVDVVEVVAVEIEVVAEDAAEVSRREMGAAREQKMRMPARRPGREKAWCTQEIECQG